MKSFTMKKLSGIISFVLAITISATILPARIEANASTVEVINLEQTNENQNNILVPTFELEENIDSQEIGTYALPAWLVVFLISTGKAILEAVIVQGVLSATKEVLTYVYNSGAIEQILSPKYIAKGMNSHETFYANEAVNHVGTGYTNLTKRVKDLQHALVFFNFAQGSAFIDGSWGSNTKSGLIAYQSKNRLDADGVCGRKTWMRISALQ